MVSVVVKLIVQWCNNDVPSRVCIPVEGLLKPLQSSTRLYAYNNTKTAEGNAKKFYAISFHYTW
jgi:hypothetical protein